MKDGEELYVNCEFRKDTYSPDKTIISYGEIRQIVGHGFYYARIDKRPYLTKEETNKIINEIERKNS